MDQIIGIYNNTRNSDRKNLQRVIRKHSRPHSSFLKKINLKRRMDRASDADIVATTDTVVTVANTVTTAGFAIAVNVTSDIAAAAVAAATAVAVVSTAAAATTTTTTTDRDVLCGTIPVLPGGLRIKAQDNLLKP